MSVKKSLDRDTVNGLKWLIIPLSALLVAFILCKIFIINAIVPSSSMEGTIREGTLLIGNRLAYKNSSPKVGDIIIFKNSELGSDLIIKRVVAVGGQTFMMKDGRVYIDGELLDEPYVTEFSDYSYPKTEVPEGYVIVLGDNRKNSYDSISWKDPLLPESEIRAKAVFSYFPEFKIY